MFHQLMETEAFSIPKTTGYFFVNYTSEAFCGLGYVEFKLTL